MPTLRRLAMALAFVGATLVNPALLAGCARPSFEFGEREVLAFVSDVVNTQGVELADGRVVRFRLRQSAATIRLGARAGLVRTATACEDRTFVRAAAACGYTTTVPLEGELEVRAEDGTTTVSRVEAFLFVSGLRMEAVHLYVGESGQVVWAGTRVVRTRWK